MTPEAKRAEVAGIVTAALGGVPVYAAPPSNVSAPCAVVSMGAARGQPMRLRWDVDYLVTLIAPGGDNDTAARWLETMIVQSAVALSEQLITQVTWDRPGTVTLAGTTYLAATLTFGTDIEPGGN